MSVASESTTTSTVMTHAARLGMRLSSLMPYMIRLQPARYTAAKELALLHSRHLGRTP